MWGTMIDYWHYTGDDTWNDKVIFGLLGQAGENHDFNPSNWSLQMGNDDQAFWGMASLGAAETKFKDPPSDQPQWLALTQAVWNEQQKRLTTGFDKDCNGGLHWQVFSGNQGYDYKNSECFAILWAHRLEGVLTLALSPSACHDGSRVC